MASRVSPISLRYSYYDKFDVNSIKQHELPLYQFGVNYAKSLFLYQWPKNELNMHGIKVIHTDVLFYASNIDVNLTILTRKFPLFLINVNFLKKILNRFKSYKFFLFRSNLLKDTLRKLRKRFIKYTYETGYLLQAQYLKKKAVGFKFLNTIFFKFKLILKAFLSFKTIFKTYFYIFKYSLTTKTSSNFVNLLFVFLVYTRLLLFKKTKKKNYYTKSKKKSNISKSASLLRKVISRKIRFNKKKKLILVVRRLILPYKRRFVKRVLKSTKIKRNVKYSKIKFKLKLKKKKKKLILVVRRLILPYKRRFVKRVLKSTKIKRNVKWFKPNIFLYNNSIFSIIQIFYLKLLILKYKFEVVLSEKIDQNVKVNFFICRLTTKYFDKFKPFILNNFNKNLLTTDKNEIQSFNALNSNKIKMFLNLKRRLQEVFITTKKSFSVSAMQRKIFLKDNKRKYRRIPEYKKYVVLFLIALLKTDAKLFNHTFCQCIKYLKKHKFFLKLFTTILRKLLSRKSLFSNIEVLYINIRGKLNGSDRRKNYLIRIRRGIKPQYIDNNLNSNLNYISTYTGVFGVRVFFKLKNLVC